LVAGRLLAVVGPATATAIAVMNAPIELVVVLMTEVAGNLATRTVAVCLAGVVAIWLVRIVTDDRSSRMSNALHANALDTWLKTATCWPLRSVWNGT
jgi:hypothetical protein